MKKNKPEKQLAEAMTLLAVKIGEAMDPEKWKRILQDAIPMSGLQVSQLPVVGTARVMAIPGIEIYPEDVIAITPAKSYKGRQDKERNEQDQPL